MHFNIFSKLKKMKFSIATKLIATSLLLLLSITIPLSYQTTTYFEKVSIAKEEESNLQTAVAKSQEINQLLKGLVEKSKAMGSLLLKDTAASNQELKETIKQILQTDLDLYAIDIYKMDEGDMRLEKSLLKDAGANADSSLIEKIRTRKPFPIASVAQGNTEIQVATIDPKIPLMIVGFPLSRNELGRIDSVMLTYLQLARIQRAFSQMGSRQAILVDEKGGVLAHPDEKRMLEGQFLTDHPLYQVAKSSSELQGKSIFQLNGNLTYRGSYAKTSFGPIILVEIPEDAVKLPALQARRQSALVAGLIISLSLLLVFILSSTFSTPIEKLAAFIREVGRGNYEVSAQKEIKTKDELGLLARVFDEMVVGLKERAKAYAVMRQALGASVIDTLMSMKEEELGGQNKNITVLFSDLRDFTKFSEGHTPEEVVTMLNEYFDVMVKVINKNGGWLDKFIGDAIMAVWGVPYPKEGDDERALKAALEMRIALAELNERRHSRGLHPLKIGIGLHSGQAIVGKIGATERANLTVIGDTVNQASRIEASTKAFGTDILVSHELAQSIDKKFIVEHAGNAEVKGKAEALKLYKLRGYFDDQGNEVRIQTAYSDFAAEAADKIKVA